MESVLDCLKIQDKQIFEDLLVYRTHDAHRLLKRLDHIHKSLQDADQKGHLKQIVPTTTKQFLQQVIQCYYRCIESMKLARSVEKLLHPWRSTYEAYIHDELSAFVSSVISKENPDLASLTAVSNLLELNLVVRDAVVKILVPFLNWIERCLGLLTRKPPLDLSTTEAGNLYILVKIVLQLFQSCPLGTAITENNLPQYKSLESILNTVYSILDIDGYATDCVLLAGTTFSYVLTTVSTPAVTVSAFWSTFQSLNNPDFKFSTDILKTPEYTPCLSNPFRKSLGPVCLVKGMVACSSAELLCYQGENQSNIFITDLYPVMIGYCTGPINLHFHSFSLLLSWFKKFSMCLSQSENFHIGKLEISAIFPQTLTLVYLNWDSPVEDVAEIVGEIFRMLLECWDTTSTKHKTSRKELDNDLPESVLSKLETTPWYVKGKYRILAILLSHMDQEKILTRYPEIRKHLQQCMSTNYLAPCGADVYKSFLQQIRKQNGSDISVWITIWLETMMQSLTNSNTLLRSNTNHYWVQSTLKVLPSVGDFLQEHMSDVLYSSNTQFPRQHVLHAWVVVSKVIRNLTGREAQDSTLLREALYSSSEETRAEAISLMCCSLRKAESLSERDSTLLMEILPFNLKIDSAPFRQHLGASVKKLLARIRDSCLAGLKVKKDTLIGPSLTFVEWLHQLLVDNLMPGACYQRRKTCLDLLTIVYDTLVYQTDSRQRKSFTPESTLSLVAYAREQNLWDFFSASNKVCLLQCLCDGADEIQEMAAHLLMKYFQWPLLSYSSRPRMTQEDFACHLLTHALNCCNSPKASESQSGALLTKIIFTKYVVEQGWTFEMSLTEVGVHCTVQPLNNPRGDNAAVKFLRTLISFIVKTLEASKTNVVLASRTSPVHGFVTACTRCVTETVDLLCKHLSDLDTVVMEMISLNIDVIDTMLKVMARDSEMELCPSFAEIGSALESWIAESEDTYTESTSLSAEYQYLLSWCWINLKESCKSLGHLTEVLDQNKEGAMKTIHRISQVFLNILTNCRHKGVIEGCRSAFARFCYSLFTSINKELNQIPELILKESLSTLVTKATSTSTTRMSAGLPIIIQTIVSCERKYKKTKLLQTALDSLFHITSLPLAAQLDDKFDLPQVHGLNILNSLYSDSSLSASLTQYIENTVKLVVDSFGSPAWAIRNAATRLFSALVTRIFGPRKSLEEGACNTLSFQEFAAHYPEIPPFMLGQLDRALQTDIGAVDKLHPSLFPVLTLLSHLGPTETAEQQHSLITEFKSRIEFLLASPVYYLRHLTASAFVAMITVQSVKDSMISLLKDIPENPCPSHKYNRLHGTLLCLEKTLVVHNACISETDCVDVMKVLKTRAWISSDPAVCPLITNTYLSVLNKLTELFPAKVRTDSLHLVRLMQKSATCHYKSVNLGQGVLTKNLVQCLLRNHDWEVENDDELVHDLLGGTEKDAKLACVSTLECMLESRTWQALQWSTIQGQLIDVLHRETYPPLLANCLSLLLNIHNTHGTNSDTAEQLYQYCCNHGDSQGGSLEATILAVMAIGIKNSFDISRPSSPDLIAWCNRVLKASRTTGDEHFRLAAAQAMGTAGHVIMSPSGVSEDVTHQECVVKLFQALSNLIQDDDTDVRVQAMEIIPHLCYKGRSIELLFEFLHMSYWWSEAVVSSLVKMLYQPKDVHACITHKLTTCQQQLFEQEDDTFCTESIFTRLQIYKSLKNIVGKCEDEQSYSSIQCLRETGQALSADLVFVEDFLNTHVKGKPVYNVCMDTAVLSAIAGCVLFGLVLVDANVLSELFNSTQLQNIISNPNLPPSFIHRICGTSNQDRNWLE
ncbi:thyroid adenoma-associated protein homolog isoform X2 [Ylistrum balloti]|uniref:thyroid adenoma-associated protein homolog isoform X2 n=1 Tax=Ylistrum balloti TaxID=509963 RepID=UPI002905BD54|nr:thyroid adenoma-associated protein homolog isoform X2 [Ylistrum balloti]